MIHLFAGASNNSYEKVRRNPRPQHKLTRYTRQRVVMSDEVGMSDELLISAED